MTPCSRTTPWMTDVAVSVLCVAACSRVCRGTHGLLVSSTLRSNWHMPSLVVVLTQVPGQAARTQALGSKCHNLALDAAEAAQLSTEWSRQQNRSQRMHWYAGTALHHPAQFQAMEGHAVGSPE
jgi:hypothetical protein